MSRIDPAAPRVVVTGLGTIAAAGCTVASFWDSVCRGNLEPARTEIVDFDPSSVMSTREARRADSRVQFAIGAATQAYEDAGCPLIVPLRSAVIIGNVHGAAGWVEEQSKVLALGGRKAVSPFLTSIDCENAPAAAIAQRFGIRGVCRAVGAACASGTYSLIEAAQLIRFGVCDLAFAGGASAVLPEVLLAAYENLRVISASGWVRPYDVRREGFVYSPGSAVMVLEREDLAAARGARLYGEVAGGASTNDAFHAVKQSGTGAVECMRLALEDAGLDPSAIAHVNAHGSATVANDQAEADAINEVFASVDAAARPSVTSIKGVTGHSLGSAGSFEALSVLLSFVHEVLPPAGVGLDLDGRIGLDIVAETPRRWCPGPTLSNSFGLGGQNGTVVLRPRPSGRRSGFQASSCV